MTPIQQMMLGAGGAKKTYLEDVFSDYLYKGTGSARSINTGVDMTKGGMTWIKGRSHACSHALFDTVQGVTKYWKSDSVGVQTTDATTLTAFNNNGFSLGADSSSNLVNGSTSNRTYASASFRNAKGFFDVVTFTVQANPTNNNRRVSHGLGCIPGMIIIKNMAHEASAVYHRSKGKDFYGVLSYTNAFASTTSAFGTAEPTSTDFGFNEALFTSQGGTFIAYVFAGGESDAATASSTKFTGSVYLTIPSSAAGSLSPGTGDFCIEAWIKPDDWQNTDGFYWVDAGGPAFEYDSSNGKLGFKTGSTNATVLLKAKAPEKGVWTHVAVTRSGSALKMFFNGLEVDSATNSNNITGSNTTFIGYGLMGFEGDISNLRFVKGSAVYTTSFKPPTEPLTNISGTELLMCNSSSNAKGSTVTPATITSSGGVNPSADSPFYDPASFKFGETGDQSIIKCGSYVGNGSGITPPEINLGFEPQWVIVKNADAGQGWRMLDSMRGVVTSDDDFAFDANGNSAEWNSAKIDFTSTGFMPRSGSADTNGNGNEILYLAIRRPDPLVQKPIEVGTDAFALATGRTDNVVPAFTSGFTTDLSLYRPLTSSSWVLNTRLLGDNNLYTDSSGTTQASGGTLDFGFNTGIGNWTGDQSAYKSWLWRRHAGLDTLAYSGNGVAGRKIAHNLGPNNVPEMIWFKSRTSTNDWQVYHKNLNGGTNPEQYKLKLNEYEEMSSSSEMNNTAPTSTHITVGSGTGTNSSSYIYSAILFSSVAGVSKLGGFTGNGNALNNNPLTVTTGFQPRFLLIKRYDAADFHWNVFDSARGLGSGNDSRLKLNQPDAPTTGYDWVEVTSTGFKVNGSFGGVGASSGKYIYYAHA